MARRRRLPGVVGEAKSSRRSSRGHDPADIGIAFGLALILAFAGLLAALVHAQVAAGMLRLWPVFLAGSFGLRILRDAMVPVEAGLLRQLRGVVAILVVDALALLPLVALAWERAGPRMIGGALGAALLGVVALIVFAIRKPTLELEPRDILVVLGLGLASALVAVVVAGLPVDRCLVAVPVSVSLLVCLAGVAELIYCTADGEQLLAGTRLYSWTIAIAAQYLLAFLHMPG